MTLALRVLVPLLALAALSCTSAPGLAPSPRPVPGLPDDPRAAVTSPLASATHVGSAACLGCHVAAHGEWSASSHAHSVRTITSDEEDLLSNIIPCSDLGATHVLGERHEVRFLLERPDVAWGEGRWLALPCSWRPKEKTTEVHHLGTWRDMPFESACAACHVTGFKPDFSFNEPGVGCESCHGPGSAHLAAPVRATILGFRGSARDEVTVCASCHLQDGASKRTGRKFPDGFVPGGSLFDDFAYDWRKLAQADPSKVLDVHQKILIKSIVFDGDESLRCTSCHAMHGLGHQKHATLPKQEYCFLCHQPDMKLKEYSQSCNVCEF